MPIEVTTRHMESHDEHQAHAESCAQSLMNEFPRTEHVHVILDQEKHLFKAEVVIQAGHHVRIEAMDQQDNMRAALDSAFDKAQRQYRRVEDRAKDRHVAMKHEASKRERGD